MSDPVQSSEREAVAARPKNRSDPHQPTLVLIEDDGGFATAFTRILSIRRWPRFVVRAASTLAEGLRILSETPADVVVLDLSLPDSAGAETFRKVQAAAPDLPVIIVSGLSDEELAVGLVQEGAQDYFIKGEGDIHLLPRAIRYAIERKRGEEALRISERRLHALADRLQTVREEDRMRLARELHDHIGQDLTVLRMELCALAAVVPVQREAVSARALEIADAVTSTIGAVRDICADLRPQMLDDLGLISALQWQVKQFSKRTRIPCRFSASDECTLDSARALAVYRVVQESLTNVLRHASANRIEICVNGCAAQLEVTVQDDGRGIAAEEIEQRQSLGILGMQERIQNFGGTFAISGTPGKGTRITVCLPLGAP